MKKAVIYARYSSDKQTEQSIEGQVYDCKRYAQAHDIQIVGEYIDRAISGRTDERPQFLKMIKDSSLRQWEYVLVWKFDRFSRNMYDSAVYKRALQKNGVKVLSAMENVTDDKNGELMEHILESFADYYSADLREKITRGMNQTALKCESTGHIPLGYKVENKKYVIDETERHIPETVFRRYAQGDTMADIVRDLNAAGYRTRKGEKFTHHSFYSMLSNEKYIGVYSYGDVRIEGGMPAMISEEMFEQVRKRLQENKKRASKFHAKADYILSGKLFCGHCGESMGGYSGVGRNGTVHYYYRCNSVKKKEGCHKKHEKKDLLELEVCRAAKQAFAEMDKQKTAEELHEMYIKASASCDTSVLDQTIRDVHKQIGNLTQAIAESGGNKFLYDKLSELTERLQQLEEEQTITSRMAENVPSVEQLLIMMNDILDVDIDTAEGRRTLIDVMISKVYVYDDRLTIVFNDGNNEPKDIPLEEIEKGPQTDSIPSAEVHQYPRCIRIGDQIYCVTTKNDRFCPVIQSGHICYYLLPAFFQSSRNLWIPMSVRGCFIICLITPMGTVAMSQPAIAACVTWMGFLMEAAIIWVLMPCTLNMPEISSIRSIPVMPMSSSLPRKGETYVAPALAASIACAAEKMSVTFVFMPLAVSSLQATRPSAHMGSFITIFLLIAARGRASSTILSASSEMTSAEMGPSTISVISLTTSSKTLPSLAMREGLVVTPQITPILLASRISSVLAVSIKSFILHILSIILLPVCTVEQHKSVAARSSCDAYGQQYVSFDFIVIFWVSSF